MTSSKFASQKGIKLPAVCHKQLEGLRPDYEDGEPNHLSAYAHWKDVTSGIDLSESFPVYEGPAANEWTGYSDQDGPNLAVHVHHVPTTNYFHFILYLREGTRVDGSVDWNWELLEPRPPFDSGLLVHHYPPPYPWTELHVKD